MEKVRKDLEGKGIKLESFSLEWIAKENIKADSGNGKSGVSF